MNFKWETKQEKARKGRKISAGKKLEGLRLMNELADEVLSAREKVIRQRLRNIS